MRDQLAPAPWVPRLAGDSVRGRCVERAWVGLGASGGLELASLMRSVEAGEVRTVLTVGRGVIRIAVRQGAEACDRLVAPTGDPETAAWSRWARLGSGGSILHRCQALERGLVRDLPSRASRNSSYMPKRGSDPCRAPASEASLRAPRRKPSLIQRPMRRRSRSAFRSRS